MRQRPGYLLVEMLAIILLMGAAAVVVTRLTTLILRVYRDVPAASAQLRVQQQCLDTIRCDAWAATTIEKDPSGIKLGDIQWSYADGTVTRTAGVETRRWPADSLIDWRWDGSTLTLLSGDHTIPLATPSAWKREQP